MPQLRASNGNRRERGLGAARLAELIFLQSESEGASEGGREGETERTRPMYELYVYCQDRILLLYYHRRVLTR